MKNQQQQFQIIFVVNSKKLINKKKIFKKIATGGFKIYYFCITETASPVQNHYNAKQLCFRFNALHAYKNTTTGKNVICNKIIKIQIIVYWKKSAL